LNRLIVNNNGSLASLAPLKQPQIWLPWFPQLSQIGRTGGRSVGAGGKKRFGTDLAVAGFWVEERNAKDNKRGSRWGKGLGV
jgi:hypothetical protein